MLKHEVMAADEWHYNGPPDLATVALCIQLAIDKKQLCSLSVAYVCPHHNPTATMGHSVHNVDISKPLAHFSNHLPCASFPMLQGSDVCLLFEETPKMLIDTLLPGELQFRDL
jgi:hypothetical protein